MAAEAAGIPLVSWIRQDVGAKKQRRPHRRNLRRFGQAAGHEGAITTGVISIFIDDDGDVGVADNILWNVTAAVARGQDTMGVKGVVVDRGGEILDGG